MATYNEATKELFEGRCQLDKDTGCWNWLGAKRKGYGLVRQRGALVSAHRLSYQVHKGAVSEKHEVMHTCDNPSCVNPNHLKLGTHADNMEDMANKKRANRGKHGFRLTPEKVQALRHIHEKYGVTQALLAQLTGLTEVHVNGVIKRRNWKDVPDIE